MLLLKEHLTSISKFSNSSCPSCAFQLNNGFSRDVLPYLCLWSSLGLAVEASQGMASASLSAIITAVAVWTAALLTISEIPSDSAISA